MTYDPAALRIEALLALPELGLAIRRSTNPSGQPSMEFPALDFYDAVEPDHDYDLQKTAAWVLDRAAEAHAAGLAAGLLASPSDHLTEVATAAGTINALTSVTEYLAELSRLLKTNLNLSDQWSLARSIADQRSIVLGSCSALLEQYPELREPIPAPAVSGLALP